MIITQIYAHFKHILTDAARALRHGPPAAPASQRFALVTWPGGSTRILAVT